MCKPVSLLLVYTPVKCVSNTYIHLVDYFSITNSFLSTVFRHNIHAFFDCGKSVTFTLIKDEEKMLCLATLTWV